MLPKRAAICNGIGTGFGVGRNRTASVSDSKADLPVAGKKSRQRPSEETERHRCPVRCNKADSHRNRKESRHQTIGENRTASASDAASRIARYRVGIPGIEQMENPQDSPITERPAPNRRAFPDRAPRQRVIIQTIRMSKGRPNFLRHRMVRAGSKPMNNEIVPLRESPYGIFS